MKNKEKVKHTAGPWHFQAIKSDPHYRVADFIVWSGRVAVARVSHGGVWPQVRTEAHANAHLITAAPELLEAVREALRQLNAPDCPSIPDGAMVRGRLVNAIKLAEGDK